MELDLLNVYNICPISPPTLYCSSSQSPHLDFLLLKLPGHLHVLQLLLTNIQLRQPLGGLSQPGLGLCYERSAPFVDNATCLCHHIITTTNCSCNYPLVRHHYQ